MTPPDRQTTSLYVDEFDVSELNWAFQIAGGPTASWPGFVQYLETVVATGHATAERALRLQDIPDDDALSTATEIWATGPASRLLEPLRAYVDSFSTIARHVPWRDEAPSFAHVLSLHQLRDEPVAWALRTLDESDWFAPVTMWDDAPEAIAAIVHRMGDDDEAWPESSEVKPRAVWRRGRLDVTTHTERRPASITVHRGDHARTQQLVGGELVTRITNVAAHALRDMTYWLDPHPALRVLRHPDTDVDLRDAARDLISGFGRYVAASKRPGQRYLRDAVERAESTGPSRLHHALKFFYVPSWSARLADYEPDPHVGDDTIHALHLALLCDVDLDTDDRTTEADVADALGERIGWNGDPSLAGAARLVALLEGHQPSADYHCAAEYHVHALVGAYLDECMGANGADRNGAERPTAHTWVARSWANLQAPLSTVWRWIDASATWDADTRTLRVQRARKGDTMLSLESAQWLASAMARFIPLDQRGDVASSHRDWYAFLRPSADGSANESVERWRVGIALDGALAESLLDLATRRPDDGVAQIEGLLRERVRT